MKYLIVLVTLLCTMGMTAQTTAKVHLLNGSKVVGELQSMSAAGDLTILLDGVDQPLLIPADKIEKYDLHTDTQKPRSQWRSRTWHATTSGAVLSSSYTPGLSLTQSLTRTIATGLEAGAALSIANYRVNVVTNVVGVSALGRYYILDQRVTPYVEAQVGYGWALKTDDVIESNGGLRYEVNVGYKVEGSSTIWHMYVGYHQQVASYLYRSGFETLSEVDIKYRRVTIGLALGF
jgi:hypothetical protein